MSLHDAIRANDLDRVKDLCSTERVDVNGREGDGQEAPLMVAVQKDYHVIVEHILTVAGVQVNQVQEDGQTALYMAAWNNRLQCVKLLCSRGDVNLGTKTGWTPLMVAARNGHHEVVEELLTVPGVQVNQVQEDGQTALYTAAFNNRLQCVKLLCSRGDVNLGTKKGNTPLMAAANKGHHEVVEELLTVAGVQVNQVQEDGWTALYWAAGNNHLQCVKLLCSRGDVNLGTKKGTTPLIAAASKGHHEVVEELLTVAGVQVNQVQQDGQTALYWAADSNSLKCVKLLCSSADVNLGNKRGYTPLIAAALKGHHEVVEHILTVAGVQVNQVSENGWTALLMAAASNSLECVKLLCSRGQADVAIKNNEGKTPLEVATRKGYQGVADYLRKPLVSFHYAVRENDLNYLKQLCQREDVGINVVDDYGRTALHYAVEENNMVAVQLLSAVPAVIIVEDKDGKTPIHLATENNNYPAIWSIFKLPGVESNAKYKDGTTLLHMAVKTGNQDALKYLCDRPGIRNVKNMFGQTPLNLAAALEECPLYFISHLVKLPGADITDVNHTYRGGKTLLHIAVETNNLKEVKGLLSEHPDIDVNVQDDVKNTPIHYALVNQYSEVFYEIVAAAAKRLVDAKEPKSISDATESLSLLLERVTVAQRPVVSQALLELNDCAVLDILAENAVKETSTDELKNLSVKTLNLVIASNSKAISFVDDPKRSFMFFLGDLYVTLIDVFVADTSTDTDNTKKHLELLYRALQSKIQCDMSRKKYLKSTLNKEIYDDFCRKIGKLSTHTEECGIQLIARKITKEFGLKLGSTNCCTSCPIPCESFTCCSTSNCLTSTYTNVSECLQNAYGTLATTKCADSIKIWVKEVSLSTCQTTKKPVQVTDNSEAAKWSPITSVFHNCRARSFLTFIFCITGIVSHVADVSTDIIVGFEDYYGCSLKLGLFEILLVIFSLIHENIRSAKGLYEMEEELLRIKLGKKDIEKKDWENSTLNYSNDTVTFVLCALWPFKWARTTIENINILIYNLLSLLMMRPIIDRLIVLIHAPMSLRVYFRQQAKQNTLKQYYLILEQLPELLIQLYMFQIVFRNFNAVHSESDCAIRNTENTNYSSNETGANFFCDIFFPSNSANQCMLYMRAFSMLLPMIGIPCGIVSLEQDFRMLDPATPKMSKVLKYTLTLSYATLVPARWFLFAGMMRIDLVSDFKFMVMGYIIVRALVNLSINALTLKNDANDSFCARVKKHVWSLFLFSLRDVFVISLRNVHAYLSNPSDVRYKSLRSWKKLLLLSLPYLFEGFLGAVLIERYYPSETEIFRYIGWLSLFLLTFSITVLLILTYPLDPLQFNASNKMILLKSTLFCVLGFIPVFSIAAVAFCFSKSRTSVEIKTIFMGLAAFLLLLVLVIGVVYKHFQKSSKTNSKPSHTDDQQCEKIPELEDVCTTEL